MIIQETHEVDENEWFRWREEAFNRFIRDIEIGYADQDIVPLIKIVFEKKNIFTTSSCSGRVLVIDADYPWIRENVYIVFKKHEPITVKELEDLLQLQPLKRFWLIVSGPIIHFVSKTLEAASKLISTVRTCGFKHSGIISMSRRGIVVEVISGTWTSFLLKDHGINVINPEYLKDMVELINDILLQGKMRLKKLQEALISLDI